MLFRSERKRLIDAIHAEGISGVIFLTGDRHHSELSLLDEPGFAPIYDLTTSPLTSSPNPKGSNEANALRVPGTFVGERNFALLDFSGTRANRAVRISLCNSSGVELWARTLNAADLKKGKGK